MEDDEERKPRDPDGVARARARLPRPDIEQAATRVRRIVCDPVRSRIVWALGAGSLTVDDLATVIGRTPAGTSQHLRVLRSLGVVEGIKVGRSRYYRLCPGGDGEQVLHLLTALRAA